MKEDILEKYKDKCTRVGQFWILLDLKVILLSVFLGGAIPVMIIHLCFFNLNAKSYIIIYLFSVMLMEALYIYLGQKHIFNKQKKYVERKLEELSKGIKENKSVDKNSVNSEECLKKMEFNKKYIFDTNPIERLYNRIQFDEFIEEQEINQNNINDIKSDIEKYFSDKHYFREYIDTAFLAAILIAVLNPVIEYIQALFISPTSSKFDILNIFYYFAVVSLFAVVAFSMNWYIKKVNNSKILQEKRILSRLLYNLDNYKFENNKLESYLNDLKKINQKENEK